ncbi:hypothetical protein GIB67_021295 [Kingdonia uniflora]|uniref:Lysosomal Pro-X carboxypeptidase n=1 Tax=Kingdonia uniflora TaxID=39325 RepID=A0A7J7LXZ0_9MAGN|nr:hypothetical protein GIB67_021295 [Kingdonia uniflora]
MVSRLSFHLFSCFFAIFVTRCLASTHRQVPRLGILSSSRDSISTETYLPPDFEVNYYTQTLDHFNYRPESYTTFQQRYIVNSRYWGGANTSSPIFVYTGDEGDIIRLPQIVGFMTENAPQFNALLVYIEHRYYGDSIPFGSIEAAFQNTSTLGYLSSTQALADYAELITYLKINWSAESCPVIAIGGSYGGMLASWFRLKYPHIVIGALASSAPILYFDDITPQNGYFSVVTKDYKEANESCYMTIRQSWSEIDKIAALPNGLITLSKKFKTCEPLSSSEELKGTLEIMFVIAAQYDHPPNYPVNKYCDAIDGLPNGSDVLSRIYAAFDAGFPSGSCHQMYKLGQPNTSAWEWQVNHISMCILFTHNYYDRRQINKIRFNVSMVIKTCTEMNIKSVLKKFASNIIFSNGLRDPYSIGGVLQNISDSVVAISTAQGSHCLDILNTLPSDPEWLIAQRNSEIKIVQGWIADYNVHELGFADLSKVYIFRGNKDIINDKPLDELQNDQWPVQTGNRDLRCHKGLLGACLPRTVARSAVRALKARKLGLFTGSGFSFVRVFHFPPPGRILTKPADMDRLEWGLLDQDVLSKVCSTLSSFISSKLAKVTFSDVVEVFGDDSRVILLGALLLTSVNYSDTEDDVWEPTRVSSNRRFHGFVVFIGDSTRELGVHFLKNETHWFDVFVRWKAWVEIETGSMLKCLESNGDGDQFCCDEFAIDKTSIGIKRLEKIP